MMKAVHTSETLIYFNKTILSYITESCHLHTRRRENLKSDYVNYRYFIEYRFIPKTTYVVLKTFGVWSVAKNDQHPLCITFCEKNFSRVAIRLWWAGQLRQYSVWLRVGRLGLRGLIPGRGDKIYPLTSVSTGSAAHTTSCTMGTGGSFPRG
jgi:hypothetical protein